MEAAVRAFISRAAGGCADLWMLAYISLSLTPPATLPAGEKTRTAAEPERARRSDVCFVWLPVSPSLRLSVRPSVHLLTCVL